MKDKMKMQDMGGNAEPFKPTIAEVYEFLQSQPLGHLASLDEFGHPQIAAVVFSQTPDLDLIIGTDESSRKALNLTADERCAFEVTDPLQRFTVQIEATGRKLSAEEFAQYEQAHFDKLPASAPFKDIAGQCYFKLSPIHLRFSDCNPHPWALTDFVF